MKTSDYILSLADRCVKCGLCLPQCPTYTLTANENESPRGRIALIQGWLNGQLAPTTTLTNHLDHCLLCRRCERVCPSLVPYGKIIDESKALLTGSSKTVWSRKKKLYNTILSLLLNKKLSGFFFSFLRLLQNTGALFIIKKSALLKRVGLQQLLTALPFLQKKFKPENFYPATNKTLSRGTIALFTGCISNQLDPETVIASIRLLNKLGYDITIPKQQTCCGALHLHDGNKTQTLNYANENISVFNQQQNITGIISLVNGCSAQLREYTQLKTDKNFEHEVKDIIEFLSEIDWPENVSLKPLKKTVAVQIPCSLQNILRAENKLLLLLKKIPALTLADNIVSNQCCGAAGTYFLRFPEIANKLKHDTLEKLTAGSPDYIISSNLGCALHLKSGLNKHSNAIKIIHPVILLEQQLVSDDE